MGVSSVKNFCSSFKITGMINKLTCFKNPHKPSCIDPVLKNCPRSFQSSCVLETGSSDFQKLVVTVMKKRTKTITYGIYKYFNASLREPLLQIESGA